MTAAVGNPVFDTACYMCGAVAGEPHHFALGETTAISFQPLRDSFPSVIGPNDHYRAVCSVCNEGASNITPDRPTILKLKAQLRKARGEDQLELLRWLVGKYPKQASSMTGGPVGKEVW